MPNQISPSDVVLVALALARDPDGTTSFDSLDRALTDATAFVLAVYRQTQEVNDLEID